jgi:predicted metal-dependent hydrolase
MKSIIYFNNIKINVEVKTNKNMYLKIDNNNEPLLIIPKGINNKIINNFLQDSLPKIQKVIEEKHVKRKFDFKNEMFVFICGLKYGIKVNEIDSNKRTKIIKHQDEYLDVLLPEGKDLEKEVFKYLKKEAHKLQKPIMDEYAKEMNLEYKRLKINSSKTRWGSCNVMTHDINLSVRLYHEPLASQVYVIVHELAHIRVPNHSKDF